ncbi:MULTISPECIES: DUF302 domain-containing protein [Amycolatopsis]|uniref:Uncharacterized protein (DUF302 family) n=1 Tax=Amycolatopsis echigonensis TaxID=2576905 RepID=A0A2N3WL79_9PSEU|nr:MULTISPECIES: DUF302 domain-containing protein [Amycolatopsis]PKV94637.1 uncharacterized protein (DUF302 family) [Amycolatopsis niigatensis]
MKLGLSRTYRGAGFDEVMARTRAALAAAGFGVLTEIDVQATLREKLDERMERYTILGACNPALAHRALEATREIGLLLPCNVVVRENGAGETVVEAINPAVMAEVAPAAGVSEVAGEAAELLESALNAVDRELA